MPGWTFTLPPAAMPGAATASVNAAVSVNNARNFTALTSVSVVDRAMGLVPYRDPTFPAAHRADKRGRVLLTRPLRG
jgi:hypothetical protein